MSAIKAGDLVVVVGGCGCYHGVIREVLGFVTFDEPGWKLICGDTVRHPIAYRGTFAKTGGLALPLSWLRRIPPLAELRYADRFEEERI